MKMSYIKVTGMIGKSGLAQQGTVQQEWIEGKKNWGTVNREHRQRKETLL